VRKLLFVTLLILPILTACDSQTDSNTQAQQATSAQIRQSVGPLAKFTPGNPHGFWDGCGEISAPELSSFEDGYCVSTAFVDLPFQTMDEKVLSGGSSPIWKYVDAVKAFNGENEAQICRLASDPKMMGYNAKMGISYYYTPPLDPASFIRGCVWGIKLQWPAAVEEYAPTSQETQNGQENSNSTRRVDFSVTADFPTKVTAGEYFNVKVSETPFGPSTCSIYNSGGQNFSGTGIIKNVEYTMTSGTASIPVLALQPGAARFDVDCQPTDLMKYLGEQIPEYVYISP